MSSDGQGRLNILMFQLKVVGLEEAELLIRQDWPTRIVGLTSDVRETQGPHHLHIQVADVAVVLPTAIYPQPEHLRLALDFTKDLTDADRLLVHCFAGQSRSTAIAIGILIQHGMSYADAFAHVESVRSILMPNELFIRHIDAHFGLDNQLVEHAKAHRTKSLQRTLILPSTAPTATDIDAMKNLLRLLGL
jgi:predicted protein tyrosine phosphatase